MKLPGVGTIGRIADPVDAPSPGRPTSVAGSRSRPTGLPERAGERAAKACVLVLAFLAAMVVAAVIVLWWAGSASAQTPDEPVPCEVAMVVGCVATIGGSDGAVSVTLEPADTPVTAGRSSGAADGSTDETTAPTVAGTTASTGDPGTALDAVVTTPTEGLERSDRPLSDLDPWERGGLKSNFGTGSIPMSHYQIGADVTGWLGVPDPLDAFVASQTNWAFTTATFLVTLASNSLNWAFEFPLAEDLVGEAGILAQDYTVDLFGFGLSTSVYSLALSVTMIFAGFKAVTKGVIVAGSEVAIAFVAYVVLIVLTLTSGFGNTGLMVARVSSDLSAGIASFAAGADQQEQCALRLQTDEPEGPVSVAGATAASAGTNGQSSACSFGFAIQRSLIELPYQNLQWGQVLDGVEGKERCAAINMELLRQGPWGNDDEPRNRMRAAEECRQNADFNHQATYIRLGIASANTVAAAAVTLLVLVVAAMLLWQQVKLLALTVTMPHALVFAILPGRSRKLAWQWVEHLFGVVLRTVALALGLVIWLSLFSLIVHEQLTLRGIFLSLFASLAMAISGFYGLFRLSRLTARINPSTRTRTEGGIGQTVVAGDDRSRPGRAGRVMAGARSTVRSVRRRPAPVGRRRPVGV